MSVNLVLACEERSWTPRDAKPVAQVVSGERVVMGDARLTFAYVLENFCRIYYHCVANADTTGPNRKRTGVTRPTSRYAPGWVTSGRVGVTYSADRVDGGAISRNCNLSFCILLRATYEFRICLVGFHRVRMVAIGLMGPSYRTIRILDIADTISRDSWWTLGVQ